MSDPTYTIPKAELDALKADVAQMATMLDGFVPDVAGVPPPGAPTITNAIATPNALPAGGGPVTINATVQNATAVTLDGVAVTLPTTVNVSTSKTFALVATGVTAPPATASLPVTVAGIVIVPPTSGSLATLAAGFARNLGPYTTGVPPELGPLNISDYGGGCYHPIKKVCYFNSGGHGGPGNQTDLRGFDPDRSPPWFSEYPPTPLAAMTLGNFDTELGCWKISGSMTNVQAVRHTYNTFVPVGNRIYCTNPSSMLGQINAGIPYGVGHAWWYDFDTGKHGYSVIDNAHWPGDFGKASRLDPVTQKIVMVGAGKQSGYPSLSLYDPAADAVTQGPNLPQGFEPFAQKLLHYPPDDSWYVLFDNPFIPAGGLVWRFVLNRSNILQTTFNQVTTTGTLPAGGGCYAFDYNPNKENFGGFVTDAGTGAHNNGKFFELKPTGPTTAVWTSTPIQVEAGSVGTPQAQWWANVLDLSRGCYMFPGSPLANDSWAYRPPA